MKIALTIAALFLAGPAVASNSVNGQLGGFVTLSNGVILVFNSGTRGALPACASTSFPTRFAFDGTTPTGQALLSVLMTSYALHVPMTLYGTGTCSVLSDTETISATVMNNLQ
jgi:hypothetical protein